MTPGELFGGLILGAVICVALNWPMGAGICVLLMIVAAMSAPRGPR